VNQFPGYDEAKVRIMKRSIALVALIAVLAAACGVSDDSAASDTTTTQAPTSTVAPTTTAPSTTITTTTTLAPSTTTTTAIAGIETSAVVIGEDPDVDAIVEAYVVVFDNTTTFEEKAPYITDTDGLEETVAKYEVAGGEFGGIALQADRIGIDGTDALVIYSFLFAGSAAYEDLEGTAVLTDAGWQIPRDFFCTIMVLARVGCP